MSVSYLVVRKRLEKRKSSQQNQLSQTKENYAHIASSRSQLRQRLRLLGQIRAAFSVQGSIGWKTNFYSTDCFNFSGPRMCPLLGRRLFTISQNSGEGTMDTIDTLF